MDGITQNYREIKIFGNSNSSVEFLLLFCFCLDRVFFPLLNFIGNLIGSKT